MEDQAASNLVSIVLTTLNGARYIQQSIDSCLGQTYRDIELIVVDGGSTDGTVEILDHCNDIRMRVIHQKDNAGKLPGALNLGLGVARGNYLTWTQDDCYYAPDAIEKMVRLLEERPDINQVYTDWWLMRATGDPEWIHVRPPSELSTAKSDLVGVSFLMRRRVREVIGEHSIDAYPSQDYDYRMRVAQRFESERIQEPLYFYRLHSASLTGRLGWPALARKDAEIRLRLGLTTTSDMRRELAEVDIAEAFERYQRGQFAEVPSLVWSGLQRDPRCGLNRGVWAIWLKSLGTVIGGGMRETT